MVAGWSGHLFLPGFALMMQPANTKLVDKVVQNTPAKLTRRERENGLDSHVPVLK